MRSRISAAITLWLAAAGAHAQSVPGIPGMDFGGFGAPAGGTGPGYVDLDAGLAYIDNARLSSTHRSQDEIALAGIDANYDNEGGLLNIRARGAVDWIHYWHHSLPSAPYGALDANAIWGRPTGPFQWLGQETFSESLANPLAAPTLANLEYVNHLTTGPAVTVHLGSVDRLTVHALYANTTYQRSRYGSNTYDGGAALSHEFNRATSVALAADEARTEFATHGIAPAYDSRNASISFHGRSERTSLTASAGYSELNFAGVYEGDPTFALNLSHELTPFNTVYINGRSGFSTAGQAAGANFGAPLGAVALAGLVPGTSSPAPFKDQLASAGWTFQRARTTFTLTGSYGRQRYIPLPAGYALVQTSTIYSRLTNKAFSAMLSRQLRPTVTVSLNAYRTIKQVDTVHASTTESVYRLAATQQFAHARIMLYVQRMQQSASGAYVGLSAGTFTANMIGLMFSYDLFGQRSTLAR